MPSQAASSLATRAQGVFRADAMAIRSKGARNVGGPAAAGVPAACAARARRAHAGSGVIRHRARHPPVRCAGRATDQGRQGARSLAAICTRLSNWQRRGKSWPIDQPPPCAFEREWQVMAVASPPRPAGHGIRLLWGRAFLQGRCGGHPLRFRPSGSRRRRPVRMAGIPPASQRGGRRCRPRAWRRTSPCRRPAAGCGCPRRVRAGRRCRCWR